MESRFPAIWVLWLGREFHRGKFEMTDSSPVWTPDLGDHLGDLVQSSHLAFTVSRREFRSNLPVWTSASAEQPARSVPQDVLTFSLARSPISYILASGTTINIASFKESRLPAATPTKHLQSIEPYGQWKEMFIIGVRCTPPI
ncbi:hypothetical protein AVEN_158758-1 [Araneus ventricosus]|uniref:Uncharacterized protein n=1 Tax=Araneus ventricosus TaxID=182803 RepID=A0A4Y2RLK0_ARAVE|nr:hypothetical protein AVEN_158758-1 [Araneus ventricosus]